MKERKPVPKGHVYLLSALLLVGLLIRLGMIWIDFDLLTCGLEVLQDDSVYNYEVARNIVEGKGITFEEGEPIFAYHPPSVLFIIPFIWLFPHSRILPIQCLLTLYTLFSLATSLFIYRIVRRVADDSAALLSSGVWILGYGIVLYSICGADTPVTLFLTALSMDYFLRRIRFAEKPRAGNYAVLGALCGLCIYSRMDTLLLLPAFALQIIWTHRRHLFWAGARRIVTAGLAMAVAVAIVTAPFFLRNLIYYKSFEVHNAASNRTLSIVMGHYARTLAQKEGLIGLKASRTPLDPELTDLGNDYYPIWWGLYVFCFAKELAVLPVKYGDVFVPLIFFGVVFVTALWRKKGQRLAWARRFYDESGIGPLGVMLLFAVMVFSLYAFYQFSFWHTSRYMYPLAFVAILYLGPIAVWAVRNIFLDQTSRYVPMDKVVRGLLLVVFVSFALQFYFFLYKNTRCEGGNGFIQAANWINENTPEDAVIGFYQGGYFGYFIRRTFHDLGGKATEKAWKAWLAREEWPYIQARGVDYILDEDFYLDFVFAWSKMYPIEDKLELVNDEFGRAPGTRILIFKVKKTQEDVMPPERGSSSTPSHARSISPSQSPSGSSPVRP